MNYVLLFLLMPLFCLLALTVAVWLVLTPSVVVPVLAAVVGYKMWKDRQRV